jgi:hypothetical protein
MPRGDYLKNKAIIFRQAKALGLTPSWRNDNTTTIQTMITARTQPRTFSRSVSSSPVVSNVGLQMSSQMSQRQFSSGRNERRLEFNTNFVIEPNEIESVVEHLFQYYFKKDASMPYVQASFNNRISTTLTPFKGFKANVRALLVRTSASYASTHVQTVQYVMSDNPAQGQGSGSGATTRHGSAVVGGCYRAFTSAQRTWNIISPESRTNCLYLALQICIDGHVGDKTNQRARKRKMLINPEAKEYSGFAEIELSAQHIKRNIILYNNMYAKVATFRGSPSSKNTKSKEDIEIMLKDNHYYAMLRRNKEELETYDTPIIETEEAVETQIENTIIKKEMNYNKYEFKVATWDIETSTIDNQSFKSYAVGLFDGTNYNDFWGMDCLDKFALHLFENAEKYNDYCFYAHNSGKFDMLLFIKEHLLSSNLFSIVCKENKNIELNGRWLNITIAPINKSGIKIDFRDSLPLFSNSLESITKDFKVPTRN